MVRKLAARKEAERDALEEAGKSKGKKVKHVTDKELFAQMGIKPQRG